MTREEERYKDYRIEFNSVPGDRERDFFAFGWAFQIFKDNAVIFRLVVKTFNSDINEANKASVLKWGKEKIYHLLDTQNYEKGVDYCYKWVNLPSEPAPQRVDCKEFLKEG